MSDALIVRIDGYACKLKFKVGWPIAPIETPSNAPVSRRIFILYLGQYAAAQTDWK